MQDLYLNSSLLAQAPCCGGLYIIGGGGGNTNRFPSGPAFTLCLEYGPPGLGEPVRAITVPEI